MENNTELFITPNDIVFEPTNGSAGFSVNSILKHAKISPIKTINSNNFEGGASDKVSDLFDGLLIPWPVNLGSNYLSGGSNINFDINDKLSLNTNKTNENNQDSDEEDIIEDGLYEKLLKLVEVEENTLSSNKKGGKLNKLINKKFKITKKMSKLGGKKTRKNVK